MGIVSLSVINNKILALILQKITVFFLLNTINIDISHGAIICTSIHCPIPNDKQSSIIRRTKEISLYCAHVCIHIHVIKQMITPPSTCVKL